MPNGIDLEAIQNSHPDGMSVDLVTVWRLLPHKNVDMLLDAWHSFTRPDCLSPAGSSATGRSARPCTSMLSGLGSITCVDFRHDVWEQKDLYSLVKAARVAVFPSAREGFGIAVLEAIACGIPVVTTSAPDNLAQHLVARSAAGIVCAPSAAAIADALRMLLRRHTASRPYHAVSRAPRKHG